MKYAVIDTIVLVSAMITHNAASPDSEGGRGYRPRRVGASV